MSAELLKKTGKIVFDRLLKEGLNKFFSRDKKKSKKINKTHSAKEELRIRPKKSHPWRICPFGEHWVRTHPLTVPASAQGSKRLTIRQGHCRANSSNREIYTSDELREIAQKNFKALASDSEVMPVPDSLGYPDGNTYDELIAGWTKFWNETLNPKDSLSPDFVKALMATESSFNVDVKDQQSKIGLARGLIQITESTRIILQDPNGELRDHLIEMTSNESREAAINISAGIRWLHHKKKLANNRLKREATWEEAGAEYKGILPDLGKNKKSDKIMSDLKELHKKLKDQRSSKKL